MTELIKQITTFSNKNTLFSFVIMHYFCQSILFAYAEEF